jgi:CO dehydrogenase/acetyl-CoA synthase gamma subunit (corrinoid Fe-S protein)
MSVPDSAALLRLKGGSIILAIILTHLYHLNCQAKEDVEKLTGWRVSVGPVCVAELPLFLFEDCI